MKTLRSSTALALVTVALVGCGEDSNPFQVIEETEFAPSLGVDLAQMQKLPSGVYIQDLVTGTGDELVFGSRMTFTYTGWLTDGTEFGSGTLTAALVEDPEPGEGVIDGLADGMIGMRVGGTRLLVIPPDQAYGDQDWGAIPAGSILVFEVTLDSVEPAS